MRATLRWVHADLRTHRGEALFSILATTGIVASLLLATALFSYATNPWQRLFNESHGAHVWIRTGPSADLTALGSLDGVASVSGPYRTAGTTLRSRGAKAAVELRGAGGVPPSTGRPTLVSGRWLEAGSPDGIVLESSLAHALWAEPGDTLTLPRGGRQLTVLGIADSAGQRYSPGESPGMVWAQRSLVDASRRHTGQIIGLRLDDPEDTDYMVQRAVTELGAGAVTQVTDWRQTRSEAQGDTRLLSQILALFGLGALLAAALAVSGAISTRIRSHRRDISVLKAIGFSPGQVVRIFLVQHLAFALLGAVLATAATWAFGSRVPGRVGDAVGIWQGLPGHITALVVVPVVAVLFISGTTSLATWRAGRVPPVPLPRASAPSGGPLSRPARGALTLGLPAPLVLGWHRAFTRHHRTPATIARLALPLLLVTVALSGLTTIDRLHSAPDQEGLTATLTARADDGLGPGRTRALLAADPQVAAVRPGVEVAALVPGQTGTIALRGIGTHHDPYPFSAVEGRAPERTDEAVAGQGLLDLLHVGVGDWVRMTVAGQPQILHIVGRSIEPENHGRVISTSLDTLRENDPTLHRTLYRLQLRPGADPSAVAAGLTAASHGRLDIHQQANPAGSLAPLRGVVFGLIVVLALIGLIEVLTAIGGSIREGERDLLALKAIGLTPRQITAITVTATASTTLVASALSLTVGLPLAHLLIDLQGAWTGIGAGIAVSPPAPLLLLLAAGPAAGAAALSILPAKRTARRRLTDALSAVA